VSLAGQFAGTGRPDRYKICATAIPHGFRGENRNDAAFAGQAAMPSIFAVMPVLVSGEMSAGRKDFREVAAVGRGRPSHPPMP